MPFLLLLWLAALGMLALPPAGDAPDVRRGQIVASPATARGPVGTLPVRQALHLVRPLVGPVSPCPEASGGHGRPVTALAAAPRLLEEIVLAADVHARSLDASHAPAARGGLLPYFATAPPPRG